MAYITIKTNMDEGPITLHERVVPSNMESEFFCGHLVERLRWAVEDAHVTVPQPSSIATTAIDRRGSGSTPRAGRRHQAASPRSSAKSLRIRDDGVGGARPGGSGLVGLRDRVEALGGTLTIDSPRGRGTTLVAKLPLTVAELSLETAALGFHQRSDGERDSAA